MLTTREALIFTFMIAGITLKLADNFERDVRGYVFAAVSATCMGLLISESSTSSSIILGIIVGVILAGKIDQPNLLFGVLLSLATAAVIGFNLPDLSLLLLVSAAALLDEVGHEKKDLRNIFGTVFKFRMVLKVTIAILTILNQLGQVYALGFFCFDIAYDSTGIVWHYFGKNSKHR